MLRNRIRDLLGKGIEELPTARADFFGMVTGGLTAFKVLGPWEVDLDVVEVVCTSAVPVAAGANTLDVFNNSISDNPIINQFDPDTLAAATPVVKAVTGNRRVAAGSVIVVKLVQEATAPTVDVNVLVRLERVIHEADAKATTYGAYPS